MNPTDASIARDVAAIGRLEVVPSLLRLICHNAGLGFAAVARVTDSSWTACAVHDEIGFGLKPGDALPVHTTLCIESRAAREPVVIDHASADPVYCNHHTPRLYKLESYVSVPIVTPSGEYFGNLCALDPRPVKVSDPQTITMFTLFADLIAMQLDSEARHERAQSALLDAQATADLREQFIAVLGHDLRNPLSAVGAAAELLSRRREPDLVTLGKRLRTATRRMSGLIDDVLDFARARLGAGIGLSRAAVEDLDIALSDVVHELHAASPERAIVSHIDISGPAWCDRGRLQQLLSNLLGNALSYGAPDQPILVEAEREGDLLTLAVTNHGAPIPPDLQARIFEPYWRPAPSARGGGLGLGLHICARIVDAHGGTLTVSSSADAGTRFEARIPVGAP